MDYKIKYSKEAISELNKAYLWYRSKDIELGNRFKNAFKTIRLNIKENRKLFKAIDTNHRRAVLGSSFPYTVHYLVNDKTKTVKIIGVLHQSKNIELVQEQIKIRKIHQQREEKTRTLKRLDGLEKIRERQELEKRQERDLGRSRDRGLEI